ncbi:N-acetylmuramoyl-L-alanine amidase [Gracilibacillus boraciitolerans JCM 21714]|uniref:N-acetylmuramoyl-L-alanine amidase n=1 Tax=Gracilibacillus boraciitolerans JCM 21714 TaxID=1298598 RepID=W4VEA0_9BACI|nr:N-acetylmuramoyl-L-alanine amidase [Gracilibacillus boraciitolerans]GAE91522.1 N-acetylmuramoyl-L-alanine amidase [Gracilibacillus boraciitolerans JCM 21714]
MAKIYIDPGHGGMDPGATGNGLREKDLTLAISLKIRKKLSMYQGISFRISRTHDKTLSLSGRTNDANRWGGADYLISVHINAGGGTGYEDYIYNQLSNSSRTAEMRNIMHKAITAEIQMPNRGMKRADFHMLRESHMPAILTENGFIDAANDAIRLKNDSFLNDIAQGGHVNGLLKIFRLKKKVKAKDPNVVKAKKKTKETNLKIDGWWGEKTTKALQKYLGTVVDSVISNQLRNAVTDKIVSGITFIEGGSLVVKALQSKVGAKVDGYLGPQTIRKLQQYIGTPVDGVISEPSMVIKELQKRLNNGTF